MVAEDYGHTALESQNHFKNMGSTPYIKDLTSYEEYEELEDLKDLSPIQKFYDGTGVFITGSTGFLGNILVEKLLRSCPTISTLYLLVRNKKGKTMTERMEEMFDDGIFTRLRRECPNYRSKIVGVGGDCSLPGLGLSVPDRRLIIDNTQVVFHVAATVRFDEKIKTAVAINIRSPHDILNLATEMTGLKSFIHVSTIFGNCVEKYIEEKIYPPAIDGKKLMLMTESVPEKILDEITPRLLGNYPNTYAFTKQIAEDVIRQETDNMPVGIFRPAIVIATYKEPLQAWINNLYGPTGVIAGAGMGVIRTLHCDSDLSANLVPVDMCVNSLIASAWQVGEKFKKVVKEGKPYEIPVYNYGCSNDQPITWGAFMHFTVTNGMMYPFKESIWYFCFNLIKSYPVYLMMTFLLHTIPALLVDGILVCTRKSPKMLKAYKKVHKFSSVLSFFGTREWIVQGDQVRDLLNQMTIKDKQIFFSDIKQLDWNEYYRQFLKGVRVYLIQDPLDTLKMARARWNRFYYAHQTVKGLLILVAVQVLYWLVKFMLRWL